MSSIKNILLTATLLLTPISAPAQTDTTTSPSTTGGTTSATDTNNQGFDYGWLGLLGLAGLRRPAPHVVNTDRSTAPRP
ncbi:WGxxGxxG family protein [Deinococcus sp.]|uniref:WGxxGxxG family protein n=1 Tax=Deinococcus sp. TaxID=47478 RepID=UPI003CC6C43C